MTPLLIHSFFAMGSQCAIHLQGDDPDAAQGQALAGEAEVRRIEARYSRYRDDSELARINRLGAVGAPAELDDETRGLITYAQACFHKSGGAFDITSGLLRQAWDFKSARIPDPAEITALLPRIGMDKLALTGNVLSFANPGLELDLGGLGKEYAADRAAETCQALGARFGFVDLGGDVRVIGPQWDGEPWRFGVRDPRRAGAAIASVSLREGAIATSGDYERFFESGGRRHHHILDPRTGWPAQGLSSVSVIADRCLVAGSLSTAALVMGEAGAAWLDGLGVRHITVPA